MFKCEHAEIYRFPPLTRLITLKGVARIKYLNRYLEIVDEPQKSTHDDLVLFGVASRDDKKFE